MDPEQIKHGIRDSQGKNTTDNMMCIDTYCLQVYLVSTISYFSMSAYKILLAQFVGNSAET
jgi:hypothetical protein